ncbi:O-Antigen ligase [Caloramator mitchellensis]|uniref:O-Antigen ligase n=1 Tax=Caloramator mitchellensis TaxID=908809 RepID=A0A0R3JW62_CALMK|nr:O-antigen ligase family protein [Caloramator mitchellensis]KRQ87824.1 O-Antigen ligase [Caloramator mitchellensis]
MMRKIYLLPLMLIFFVPLVVYEKAIILKGDLKNVWFGGVNFDYFSYYKSRVFLVLILFGLVALLYRLRKEEFEVKWNLLYIPMGFYASFVVLSTIFSKYKSVAFIGFPDRYEGAAVLVGYMILVFLIINLVKKDDVKVLINMFLVSSILIGIIGFFQFFRMDFVKDYILSRLVPFQMEYIGRVIINFTPEDRAVYSTLYHSNYVGSYMALAFIISFILYVLDSNKNKFIYAIISIIMYFNLIGSHSRAGILGSLVAVILFILIRYKDVLRNIKFVLPMAAIYIVIFIFINNVSGGYFGDKIGSLFVDLSNTFSKQEFDTGLRDIYTEGDKLCLAFDDGSINFIISEDKVKVTDEYGKDLKFDYDQQTMELKPLDERFTSLKYYLTFHDKFPGVRINNGWQDLTLVKTFEGYHILSRNENLIEISRIEKIDFKGKERLGSNRVYIWSRSIPLIKKTALLGFGPDTYAFYYPQNDYIGKYIYFGTTTILVDKPHNMYIQDAINIGILGLISLLFMFIYYFYMGRKLIFNRLIDEHHILHISIYFAILAYLIAGVFNDSVVSVAPVFWALFGVGVNLLSQK